MYSSDVYLRGDEGKLRNVLSRAGGAYFCESGDSSHRAPVRSCQRLCTIKYQTVRITKELDNTILTTVCIL